MAVPGAFAPVNHEGKVLVDGGIVNNLPLDVARADGRRPGHRGRRGLSRSRAPETVDSTFEILLQMVSGLMRDRSDATLATLGPARRVHSARAWARSAARVSCAPTTRWGRAGKPQRPRWASCARFRSRRTSTSRGGNVSIAPLREPRVEVRAGR